MEEKVLSIINEIRAVKDVAPVETISAGTKLREDLNLTSFDLAELTVKIEDEFDISIPTVEIKPENFNSAAALWAMIQRLQDED